MKDYTKIYTIIFWLSMLYILLWVILKATGVINTPELIELSPIITAIFGAGVFFQMMRDTKYRLDKLENRTHNGFKDVDFRFREVDFRFKEIDAHIMSIDKRLAVVESKI